MEERIYVDFLKKVRLFSTLNDNELLEVSSYIKKINLKKGVILCTKGAPTHYFYIIYSGNVTELITDSNDFSASLKTEGMYNYFGELGILLDEGYASTVITMSTVEVICIQKHIFADFIWKNNEIVKIILKSMKERLQTAGQKEIAFTQMNAESKLAYILIMQYNNNFEEKACVEITQEQLALNCGMVRQTVSTILNKWKKRDIVDLKKRKIIILQPYILADIFLEVSD